MVHPDPIRPILVLHHRGTETVTKWHRPPWVMPADCAMWWTARTGWIPGPVHSLRLIEDEQQGKKT